MIKGKNTGPGNVLKSTKGSGDMLRKVFVRLSNVIKDSDMFILLHL